MPLASPITKVTQPAQTAPETGSSFGPSAWSDPMPREERDALIEKAATFVVRRGLESPAIWALEMHKPFGFLMSQAVVVGAPSFGPLIGIERMQTLSRFLASEGAIERLIERIEERSIERQTAERAAVREAAAKAAVTASVPEDPEDRNR